MALSLKKSREWILTGAELFDAWRVVPRLTLAGYFWLMVQVASWYMALKDPNGGQAAFAGGIVAAFAPLCNWYYQTGRDWAAERTRNGHESGRPDLAG